MVSVPLVWSRELADAPPDARWPALREELRLHHGPAQPDGQPTWTLQDPVRHRFVRLDWVTYEVLRRWWLADVQLIVDQVNSQTTLAISEQHVHEVLSFARRHELVQPVRPPAPVRDGAGMGGWARWLLHHYLFFRIPLFNPDAWLQRWLPRVAALGSGWCLRLSLAVLALAAVLIARDWSSFAAQAVDLLSWRGLALYGATLVATKAAHELGHAFVARHHGCRVPTMGVAFMVLWPMAYTDTSEVWRLADARARLAVALAGVRTELTIAAWALLAWTLLPDGPLRTAAFILGTLTWVTTVLVNLSPFMRFDGYFVLCDLLDQPNLHERSFAMARWWLRRELLGWSAPAPEMLARRARRAMVAFALLTWLYRLILFLGIAWLVYHFAFKALGIVLFAVEIGWFIALPVWREVQAWRQGHPAWRGSDRARRWRWLAPLLVALGFVPLPSWEGAGAVLQPAQHLAVRLPSAAVIDAVHVRAGELVRPGTPLLQASSAVLQQRLEAAQVRIRQLQAQVAGASVDTAQQSQWAGLQEQLATARDEERAVAGELARLQPVAPFGGQVLDVELSVRPGGAVGPQQVLLHLATPHEWRVVAYASEDAARALRAGDSAAFTPDAAPLRRVAARVASIAPHSAAVLGEPMLAQALGGAVDALQQGQHWVPRETLYRIELAVLDDPALAPRQWRGHVALPRPWRSVWQRAWTVGASVAVREFGF